MMLEGIALFGGTILATIFTIRSIKLEYLKSALKCYLWLLLSGGAVWAIGYLLSLYLPSLVGITVLMVQFCFIAWWVAYKEWK